jgi:hypothetical protein
LPRASLIKTTPVFFLSIEKKNSAGKKTVMVFSAVRGPALLALFCLLRSSFLLTRIQAPSSTLSATCRALRPYLMIYPPASPPGDIKAETRSGGASVARLCYHKVQERIKSPAGPLPAPPGAAPWRWWRTLRPRPLTSSLPRPSLPQIQVVHFALK